MTDLLKQIVELMTNSGTLRKAKSEGSKGLLVFNPVNLDFASIERIASQIPGLGAVNTPHITQYNNKSVPPHVWVGPEKIGPTISEGVSSLADELGM